MTQKRKILNDPVYGFISIRHAFILELIDHPWFQRLRRIAQLGLSHLVYPGALHNRFQHAIGAMHLMQNAVDELRLKGNVITDEEEVSLLCAILLHDIGHGPFSHALEYTIASEVHHERISSLMMNRLNEHFNGKLTMAIAIFNNEYPKKFLHQLVSSQLDMDRLDYLARDSFFSGVVEGQVGSERILKMLDVVDDQLVVEEKGIYSIEKFIVARRFMYWQVYLHKTVVAAEHMLIHALRRAKHLSKQGVELFASPALAYFLTNDVTKEVFKTDPSVLDRFAQLDDYDILGALKVWQSHPDKVLSLLATRLVNRQLFKIEISREPFSPDRIQLEKEFIRKQFDLDGDEVDFFVYSDILTNNAYNQNKQNINMLMKNGEIIDLTKASDNLNISALANPVEKYFLCYPV